MQNDFVMKAKNAIKKVAALTGTAIMASSMMMPVMAATLADLPAPFVSNGAFNANIVVGSIGTAAGISNDLAGAMDVAAAFAQQTAGATATGAITLERPMTPGTINSSTGYLGIGDSSKITHFNASDSGFEWLSNVTLRGDATSAYNDTDYNIFERLSIIGSNSKVTSDGSFETSYGNIVYNVTSNGTALPIGTSISLFGKDYQLISSSTTNLELGVMTTEADKTFPSTVSIPGCATVAINDFTSAGDIYITVTHTNGTVMYNKQIASGTVYNDIAGCTFWLENLRDYQISGNVVDLVWTTSSVELENTKNASAIDDTLVKWTAEFDANTTHLFSLAFKSPYASADKLILSPGESLSVMDYFDISFEGWRELNTTNIVVSDVSGMSSTSIGDVSLNYYNNDSSSSAVEIRLGSIKDGSTTSGTNRTATFELLTNKDSFIFDFSNISAKIWGDNYFPHLNATGNITVFNPGENLVYGHLNATTLGNNTWSYYGNVSFTTSGATYNLTYANKTGYTGFDFNLSLVGWQSGNNEIFGVTGQDKYNNMTAKYKNNIVYNTSDAGWFNRFGTVKGVLKINESSSETSQTNNIVVTYENNTISTRVYNTADSLADGASKYTTFGTLLTANDESVEMVVPQTRRYADVWIGRSATETSTVNVGDEIDGSGWTVASSTVSGGVTPITPGLGASAASYSSPVSLLRPTIIIGGGEANSLTGELAANEEGVTTAELLEATNKAYLQLIENAFGGSQTVLVVAGRDAKDTKLACQALAAHVTGTRTLALTGNLVWLDTTSASYTAVSVVAE
ncbi:MAG: hypothetical protein PHG04_01045 [Candidatus Nanoarchaeia archaeon]|nr:hypothetical protein [Candidatus Nanoarchaeia archaeon]